MNLIDTSVWIEFFRDPLRAGFLVPLLEEDQVLLHPWVFGELLLGGIGSAHETLSRDLARLHSAPLVPHDEVLHLIRGRHLTGRGIGWVDAQLLASALIADARLWTFDRKLAAVAGELEVEGLPVQ